MRHRAVVLLTTVALVLTGCTDGPADDGPPEEPSATPSGAPTTTASPTATPDATPAPSPDASPVGELAGLEFTACEADRFTVPYPASWQVNEQSDLVEACRVFHPGDVDLPDEPQGIGLQWAAYVHVDQVPFEDVVGAQVQGEVLTERDATVAGRDARLLEYRSDGSGLVPEGEQGYRWAVDLGDGETLVVSTNSVGATDYRRDTAVVDRMVQGLRLGPPAA